MLPGSPLPNDDECQFGRLAQFHSLSGQDPSNLANRIWEGHIVSHSQNSATSLTMDCFDLNIPDSRKLSF